MNSSTLTKKVVGTAVLLGLFFGTSFIGTSVASAYFTVSGKNIQFHAIVDAKSANSWTVLTSSTDPLTILVNGKTKYPFGIPNKGDVIFVVGRIKTDGSIVALVIKKSKSGGTSDIYGTEGDDVSVRNVTFKQSSCPFLRVTNPVNGGTTVVFKVDQNTRFVGATGCEGLTPGDKLSITGVDTNGNGFVAKTVMKQKDKKEVPDNEVDN